MTRRMRVCADDKLVYAVVCPSQATIKIGHSADPWERLRGLATGAPAWLFLWAVWEGGARAERRAHRALAAHCAKGEWFHAHPDVVAYVLDNIQPDWADAVREDYRVAGAVMHSACSDAAWEDEEQDDEDEDYGIHRHKLCSIAGTWEERKMPRFSRLREGYRYLPGNLVPEPWINDVGSPYWVLTNPVEGPPEPPPAPVVKPRRRKDSEPNPHQPSLFEPARREP